MLGERHDLPHEFPEFKTLIEDLRTKDPVFDALAKAYDALDDEIIKIEQNIHPHDDFYTEEQKKKRVILKDKLYEMLKERSKH